MTIAVRSRRIAPAVVVSDPVQSKEIRTVTWDFHRHLDAGETIASVEVGLFKGALSSADVFTGASDPDSLKSSGVVDGKKTLSKASVTLQDLEDGSDYKVEIVATVNADKKLEADVVVPCRDF